MDAGEDFTVCKALSCRRMKSNISRPFSAGSYEIARGVTSPFHKEEGRKEGSDEEKKEYEA